MQRAQAGDARAYDLLLRSIAPQIRTMALRILHDPQDVEDAVQDVLAAVHAVRHTYDPNRPFGRWLGGIAHHRFVDLLRARERGLGEKNFLGSEESLSYSTFLSDIEAAERKAALEKAIQALPPGERQALDLLKLKGLSLLEAGSLTGLSVSALKVASHRAMRRLAAMLRSKNTDP